MSDRAILHTIPELLGPLSRITLWTDDLASHTAATPRLTPARRRSDTHPAPPILVAASQSPRVRWPISGCGAPIGSSFTSRPARGNRQLMRFSVSKLEHDMNRPSKTGAAHLAEVRGLRGAHAIALIQLSSSCGAAATS